MSNLNIEFNNISLDNIFEEDDPDTIILIRLLVWNIKVRKRKARWWDCCVLEDEKKEIDPKFIEEL